MHILALVALSVVLIPGVAFGQPKAEPIKREQSRLWLETVPGLENAPVTYIYVGWTPNYSAERFYAQAIARGAQLPRVHVNYTMAAPGYVWLADSALGEKYIKTFPFFKDREVAVPKEHGGGSAGTITVPFRSGDAHCFAFLVRQVAMGTMGGSGANGRSSIDGIYCAAPGSTIDATLTHQILASILVTEDLSRIREPLVAPVAKTPAITPPHIAAPTPTPTPPAATAPPPAPKPAQVAAASLPLVGWSAPPGTRFITRNGFIEIVRVEEGSTITVNKSNSTGRWAGGLLSSRSRGSIDPGVITQLQPIAVGKEVTFEEKGNGDDRWRYTIRVTGTETVTIKERSYQAFVITARDQSLNPDQGGFDRTRTMWYSPEAGGILKQRVKQDSGPPVTTNTWEVVEIIPASAAAPAASAQEPPRSITAVWQGVSNSLSGSMEVQPEVGGGRFNLTLPEGNERCFGAWRRSQTTGNASQGSWSINCGRSGLTAKGTYRMDEGHRGAGVGVDTQERKIELKFGS